MKSSRPTTAIISKICSAGLLIIVFGCQDPQVAFDTSASAKIKGVANFENLESFEKAINQVSTLSPEEFSSWEKEKGFVSFHTVFNEALSKLNLEQTQTGYQNILTEYSDILYLSTDSVLTPKISHATYQKICNREGIYKTSGAIIRLFDDNKIVRARAERYKDLIKVNTTENLDKST